MTYYTDDEKKAWRERMRGLVKQVAGMTPEARATMAAKMPIITCEGHALSVFNQCFLMFQSGSATLTVIGGFRQWKKTGRAVKEGSRSIGYIYVPMVPKQNGKEEEAGEPEDVRFRLVPVFDVSQTDELSSVAR